MVLYVKSIYMNRIKKTWFVDFIQYDHLRRILEDILIWQICSVFFWLICHKIWHSWIYAFTKSDTWQKKRFLCLIKSKVENMKKKHISQSNAVSKPLLGLSKSDLRCDKNVTIRITITEGGTFSGENDATKM